VRRQRADVEPRPFHYRDLGTLASTSKSYAIAQFGPLRLAGFAAWLVWLFVHLLFLTGFKNRVATVLHWTISFVGRDRAERTITWQEVLGRRALDGLRSAADVEGGL